MVFGTRQKLRAIENISLATVDGNIDKVDTFNYLYMTLDSSLIFQAHLDNTYKKACQQLSAVHQVRNCLNKSVSLILYKSLILPYLDYGIPFMSMRLKNRSISCSLYKKGTQEDKCRLYAQAIKPV